MVPQRSGLILTLTGPAGRVAQPLSGGFGVACAAIEPLSRALAAELGPHGVRVVCLQPGGMPETPNVQQSFAEHAGAAAAPSSTSCVWRRSRTLPPFRRLEQAHGSRGGRRVASPSAGVR